MRSDPILRQPRGPMTSARETVEKNYKVIEEAFGKAMRTRYRSCTRRMQSSSSPAHQFSKVDRRSMGPSLPKSRDLEALRTRRTGCQ